MKTVEQRYGIPFSQVVKTFEHDHKVQVAQETNICYAVIQDALTVDTIPVLSFDHFRIYDDLEVGSFISKGLRVTDTGLPLAVLSTVNLNVDDWVNNVKTNKKYLIGNRFNELATSFRATPVFSNNHFQELLISMSNIIYEKELQYNVPKGAILQEQSLVYKMMELAAKPVTHFITYEAHWNKNFVFKGFAYRTDDGVVYVPFVLTTRDTVLQKRYSPASVFHVQIVKMLTDYFWDNINLIDFGIDLPYKAMFGFQKAYSKGLEFVNLETNNVL